MNLGEYLERWGRAIFERPFEAANPDEPPELAEIRLALVDHIREHSYRSGGRRVFPFNLVRVRVLGIEEGRAAVFRGNFFRNYFEKEVRESLERAGCRFPEDLGVEVDVASRLPERGEAWMTIETECGPSAAAAPLPEARLVVVEGTANVTELAIRKARTNIGRAVDVYREEGLFRRNDLAFSEDNEINRSVSREHAHIRFDRASGECRLFNDRWYRKDETGVESCGTWIVRDGLSLAVDRGARGTRLEPGDEIHLGRAIIRFEAGNEAPKS